MNNTVSMAGVIITPPHSLWGVCEDDPEGVLRKVSSAVGLLIQRQRLHQRHTALFHRAFNRQQYVHTHRKAACASPTRIICRDGSCRGATSSINVEAVGAAGKQLL